MGLEIRYRFGTMDGTYLYECYKGTTIGEALLQFMDDYSKYPMPFMVIGNNDGKEVCLDKKVQDSTTYFMIPKICVRASTFSKNIIKIKKRR